jgi:hypothetical protein
MYRLHFHSTQKTQMIHSSEMLIMTYKTAWYNNPGDHNPHFHHHEVKSHIIYHCGCDLDG